MSTFGITQGHINARAKDIIARLESEGVDAYIVGGAVRDLVMGNSPKDWDIAAGTDCARIKKILPKSRVIGKRFPIVHARRGREIFEVTPLQGDDSDKDLLRADVMRRDCTVNALVLHLADETIIDYVGALEDIEHSVIKIIGQPKKRFEEDSVRILRAYRFAARLGFSIDPEVSQAAHAQAHLLGEVSPGRLALEKEKDFLGELNPDLIAYYRSEDFAQYIDANLAQLVKKISDDHLALYGRMADAVQKNPRWDDPKGICRLTVFSSLALPELFSQRQNQSGSLKYPQILDALKPWLKAIEVPKWKHQLIARALSEQRLLDAQLVGGNLSHKHIGKEFYGYAITIAKLRSVLLDEESSNLKLLDKHYKLHRSHRDKGKGSDAKRPSSRGGRNRRGNNPRGRRKSPRRPRQENNSSAEA